MSGGLAGLAALRYFIAGSTAWWLIGPAGGFLLIGLLAPLWLNPIRVGWMKLAAVLGFVNSRILLTLLFVGLITPLALLLRVLGRQPIDLGRKSDGTYWHPRVQEDFSASRMERQF